MATHTHRFRALAILLSYPEQEWIGQLPAVLEPLRDIPRGAPAGDLTDLERFFRRHSLEELQEYYVSLFDRTRSVSLHLLEHSHGDARERGSAMARLSGVYLAEGWTLDRPELPDYLPAFCEFLALVDAARGAALLAEASPVIVQLTERLRERGSVYATVLELLTQEACLGLSSHPASPKPGLASEAMVTGEGDRQPLLPWQDQRTMSAEELGALDAEWEDSPVTFSPGAAHDSIAGFVPVDRIARGASAKDQLS